MAYPSALSSFTYPNPTQKLNSPSQSSVVSNLNDAVLELERFVGTASSAIGTLVYDIRATASDGGGHIQAVNKGGTGQTSYAKGDILIASSSSVLSKLTVGNNNEVLTVDSTQVTGVKWTSVASGSSPTAFAVTPRPIAPLNPAGGNEIGATLQANESSSMMVGLVNVPLAITVNQLTIGVGAVTTAGQLRFAMYSENGRSSLFSASTATITAPNPSIVSMPLSSISVAAGNYYIGVVPVSSAIINLASWNVANSGHGPLFGSVAGKVEVYQGYVSVAGATPAAITSSIVSQVTNSRTLAFRLDN